MNKQKKEIKIDKAELNEKDLEKVDGGIRVVVGDGKMGTCEKCRTYRKGKTRKVTRRADGSCKGKRR